MAARDLTLFVGAGISRESGGPNFLALRNLFMRPLIGDDADSVSEDEVSPELLFGALDDKRDETLRTIRRELWWECEPHQPGRTHHAIAAMIADGARAWTTNFDTLIERAALRCAVEAKVITCPQVSGRRPVGPALIKVHGSFPWTGDPPREPDIHDYNLRFRSADVWSPLSEEWVRELAADVEGREVHFYGYRGADLDLIPALLETLPRARRVVWWELQGSPNLVTLERRFGALAEIRAGNPSEALAALGADAMRRHPMAPSEATLPISRPRTETISTYTAKAALEGQFRGAATARRRLAAAVVLDPRPLKKPALFRLVRSSGFDRPHVGRALLTGFDLAGSVKPAAVPALGWLLFAAILDAQPLSAVGVRSIRTLLSGPHGSDPNVTIRVGSYLKRAGDLSRAQTLLEDGLAHLDLQEERNPLLEAMAVYNLLWVARQRWHPDERQRSRARLSGRAAHIGFNWSAWIALDDAAFAMQTGKLSEAREAIRDPFVSLASDRLHHVMFLGDLQLARSLEAWFDGRPSEAARGLERVLTLVARPDGYLTFTAVDALTLSADLARVEGDRAAARGHLARARSYASPLQLGRIELVRALIDGDEAGLTSLAERADRAGQGLVATCAAAIANSSSRSIRDSVTGLVWEWPWPLPALY